MARLFLFYRLIVRPLLREPLRTLLMVLAVALGVAVVLAIDLAGNAAAGSFRSSMETLTGESNLEITAAGGVPELVLGTLAMLPYAIRISPRIEGYAVLADTQKAFPLIGLDLIAEGGAFPGNQSAENSAPARQEQTGDVLGQITENDAVWVGASLGYKQGDRISLLINDEIHQYTVRGVFRDSGGNDNAILMDIATAQDALRRSGRVDRILLKVPATPGIEEWQQRLRSVLPAGVNVQLQGTETNENRTMLAAFRLNLRLLSYISLVVGAFLIFNTISVSVVRRRPEIGIVRALGASRRAILSAFVGEAACLGTAGAAIGLPLGRAMATGAVKLIGATGAISLCEQPARASGIDDGLGVSWVCNGNRNCRGFCVCTGARGFAGSSGGGDGARTPRIRCAGSQDSRLVDRAAHRGMRGGCFLRARD